MSGSTIALVASVELATATGLLYWHLRRQPDRLNLWLATLRSGAAAGLLRAGLASGGWSLVDQAGPVQLLAYALALTALPEAIMLDVPVTPVSAGSFVPLLLMLVGGAMAFASLVALVVESGRRRKAATVPD